MNIIIMNNRASFLVSFWSVLISRLQEEGHQVTCLVPVGDSEAEATLKGFGASIRNYPLDNKGLRSEERRVGKECRSRRWPDDPK